MMKQLEEMALAAQERKYFKKKKNSEVKVISETSKRKLALLNTENVIAKSK